MSEKLVFEIPVYALSEKAYNRKLDLERKKHKQSLMISGRTEAEAEEILRSYPLQMPTWKYNQIVGYIAILATKQDVLFELYCTNVQRIRTFSKVKHDIHNWHMIGTHFYAANMTDSEIKSEVRKWLPMIEKDHLKRFHVDYSVFDTVFNHISIRRIMDAIE
jgi:hypothetical protein